MGRVTVRTLALRALAAHRARLAMTLAAVVLGTAFVAGTLCFTDSTGQAADAPALRNALLGFAAIAVLVGAFVIANTFTMLVGQRTRELALLRAVGLFNRDVRELLSTYYQFDAPFIADHTAFTTAFGGHITDWNEIIHTTIESYSHPATAHADAATPSH